MRLVIFGATGMVGKQLVKQALFNGDHVIAFGRNVFIENLPKDDNLELVQGALFDEGRLLHAIQGCDAVLSALGGSIDGSDKTRSLGMKKIIQQMDKAGVKRIIGIGALGILNANENTLILDEKGYPPQFIPVGKEHQKAYEYLKASDLEWTFVCPPVIKEGDPTGIFITNADYPPQPNKFSIRSGDLALFMLKELKTKEYVGHRVGISN